MNNAIDAFMQNLRNQGLIPEPPKPALENYVGPNPFRRATRNITTEMRLARTNPALAEQLRREAERNP